MTEEQMKSLKVGDICKDVEVSGNYGIDVFCKVTNVENDRIEIDCIEDNHCNAYPLELFYRTCSWKLEKLQ
ncbi:MAG: hypothetical protein AB7D03_04360 [Thiomicrospira sp.]|jgi:hypothetical protein